MLVTLSFPTARADLRGYWPKETLGTSSVKATRDLPGRDRLLVGGVSLSSRSKSPTSSPLPNLIDLERLRPLAAPPFLDRDLIGLASSSSGMSE